MATASTGLCVRPSSKPSMGVAPPEGGDCSRLVAGRLFLFLRFLLSQEAEDTTPSPEPGSPGWTPPAPKQAKTPPPPPPPPKDDGPQPWELQHQAASPQPPQAPKPGWCPAWHQTALEPPKVPALPMPTLPATKPWWGPMPCWAGRNPLRAPTPPTSALPPFRGEQQPSPSRSIAAAWLQLLPWHRGTALPQQKPRQARLTPSRPAARVARDTR